ncbi:probable serine/threonine-protein kinase DDB_G0278845 isoform X1 [Ceratitis capitata]|uniref:probable serine/threonine-protein kinase DDB_G0278845 isoform X1 n=1 Tax=Ceratitis capitata TaxID=7213 RepID=UPI0006187ED2|nr:probable serine/threonine-protein kinase DDB_G0278845 isoform X1 [Ceratitis capitata]
MFNLRSQLDKIIITAMDRFVWFVLLVVMSHLVTEFTRVTGYARGNRHDVVLLNDTAVRPMPVANMIFYPGEEYGLYDHQMPQQYNNIYPNSNYNSNNNNNRYGSNGNSNNNNNYYNNANMQTNAANAESAQVTGFPFSFRPLIDSIFEIPISTLRAVNNLVARLTGSYQHQVPSLNAGVLKSTNPDVLQALRLLPTQGQRTVAESTKSASDGLNSAAVATPQQQQQQHKETENSSSNSNSNNNNNQESSHIIRVRRSVQLAEVNA